MSDDFNADAHINRLFKDYLWPEPGAFYQVGLHISPQRAEHLQVIEEALYQLVQARYPDLFLERVIRVSNYRTYDLEIKGNINKQRF
jgi:hypothetical protein